MLVAVISLACLVAANSNNAPTFNASKTVWDCTLETVGDKPCEIALVVEPFMSMTYYDIIDGDRKLVGYRARYDENGSLVLVSTTRRPSNEDRLHPPITVDGEFRPLITVNGQMPGPTIIARENQMLHITVYNELPNVEGISIHWHGMHQRGTSAMDGVAFISQKPIPTHESFTYKFKAFPNGTHWYHAHSGAHRTDGLYGALIVKDDMLSIYSIVDRPEEHTLLLMDWQKDPSIDLFYQIRSSLGFYDDEYTAFDDTKALDNTQVAPIPFWSGIINDKGRHYNKSGQHNFAELNRFNVTENMIYRFRLIGAQALYAYKFSVENHLLTVIATDGNYIELIEDVHYVIVNTGERYDVIVYADQEIRDYWILAETLEDPNLEDPNFYNSIMNHKAEAILHYEGATQHFSNPDVSRTWSCSSQTCYYVNCPYVPVNPNINCTNVEKFRDMFNTSIGNPKLDKNLTTFFYDFGFDGENSTRGSSVDGINFRFPSDLPSTNAFRADVCPGRGCDHNATNHCTCTHVIDISRVKQGDALDLVITNSPGTKPPDNPESSHPVHLHGHSFYVVKVGYPDYYPNGTYKSPNKDIECIVEKSGDPCEQFITVETETDGSFTRLQTVRWKGDMPPEEVLNRDISFPLKDTVIVPYGGYTVIRFITDNPGWWLLHCHIEIHQLEGMAAVVRESGQGMW